MQNAAQSSSRASSAHQADDLLETGRTFFLLAGNATAPADVARYAAIGRDYLERAHAAASVDVIGPMPLNLDLPDLKGRFAKPGVPTPGRPRLKFL